MTVRAPADVQRGRGIGIVVGSAIAAGWALFGLRTLGAVRGAAMVPVLLIAALIIAAGIRIVRLSRTLPRGDAAGQSVARNSWRLFWLNLVAEIVLLNAAVAAIGHFGAIVYLIPAISLIVGLHFLPMAVFFDASIYWITGCAMIALAALATLAITLRLAPVTLIAGGEAMLNALILWGTGAVGYLRALTRIDTLNRHPRVRGDDG